MAAEPVVVTRTGLLLLGRSSSYGDRQVRRGRWERAAPSTWLTADADLLARLEAATAHAGADAVVTGWAACAALGLPYVPDGGAVPVLVPAGRRRVSTSRVAVMPTTRPPRYRAWQAGVRLAAPERCVVDAARALSDLRAVRALVLGALGTRRVRLEELVHELDSGARAGSALCRRVLEDARRGAASAPEAEFADALVPAARLHRLPYLLNPDVLLDGRLLGRPDGWLVGLGLGWEVESREHHAGDEAFEATLARSDAFLAAGVPLLHVTPRRLRASSAECTGLLLRAAGARRRSGASDPPGLVVVPRGPVLPLPRRGTPGAS